MKVRLPRLRTLRYTEHKFQSYLAIDINEIAGWGLKQNKQNGELQVWLKGIPESVCFMQQDVGEIYFDAFLTLLKEEFPHIDDAANKNN